MASAYTLEFEKPLLELERQIEDLKRVGTERQIDIDATAERVWALVSTPGWWINDGTIVEHLIERRGDLDDQPA